ncbi:MAG: acylphosphatase [Butyrivibrio sp.]|jgi:acylphosphatase|nr:acylphosphatase [Butyrivibrio sp.]
MVRKQIYFYGMVQGVGFRYRAVQAARLLGLTGSVRNESDGSVSMQVQGKQQDIDQMIEMIRRGTYVDIERMEVKEMIPEEHESGFYVYD